MLKRNSVKVHSTLDHTDSSQYRNEEPAGRMGDFGNFLKFLNGLARPEYWLSAICLEKL